MIGVPALRIAVITDVIHLKAIHHSKWAVVNRDPKNANVVAI